MIRDGLLLAIAEDESWYGDGGAEDPGSSTERLACILNDDVYSENDWDET